MVRPSLGILAVSSLAIVVGGCSFLPADGPRTAAIVSDSKAPYPIIPLDANKAALLKSPSVPRLHSSFGSRAPNPRPVIRPGDVVIVSIWEAATGGLFTSIPTAGMPITPQTTLPAQVVDHGGFVRVPFVGQVKAIGSTAEELAKNIEQQLQGKAIEPQVLVTLQQVATQSATVAGEVTGAARVPLSPKGDRLLEVIAQAGGVKLPAHQTLVRLSRGGRTETVRLSAVVADPRENVLIHPGDTIFITRHAPSVTIHGAVRGVQNVPLENETVTLAEVVAKAGGLSDVQADASSVFVFRHEEPARAAYVGAAVTEGGAPLIYKIDMRSADGYFAAKSFTLQDGDLIYAATASSIDVLRFFTLIRAATTAISGTQNIGLSVE